jgi:hypothetical protein
MASLVLTDVDGKRVEGDAFAVTGQWDRVEMDLHAAFDAGLDVSRVATMGLVLRPLKGTMDEPVDVQTDDWMAEKREKTYLAQGERTKGGKTVLSVESRGGRLRIGTEQFELTLWNRGTGVADDPRPWLEVSTQGKKVFGPAGTGLCLLDQESFDRLSAGIKRGNDDEAAPQVAVKRGQVVPWPMGHGDAGAKAVRGHWEMVWTSPIACIVDYKQEFGPYDRLGEPAILLTWRLMTYQWGQTFVHVDWTSGSGGEGRPITWAMGVQESVLDSAAETGGIQGGDAQRLLTEIYPAIFRQGLQTALPHRMQSGSPVGMIAKSFSGGGLDKSIWWWANMREGSGDAAGSEPIKLFGAGLTGATAERGSADCMLVLNGTAGLTKAATFGEYLVPPKLVTREGEVDRNFPGDVDNDGFVEGYGFQVVRLAHGRATFTIYPQGRPLFYSAFLFTVPAVEREALDVAHSRVLINLDGQQFADPPQFPDGSFLLQLPYVLDKPVTVEAILVRK